MGRSSVKKLRTVSKTLVGKVLLVVWLISLISIITYPFLASLLESLSATPMFVTNWIYGPAFVLYVISYLAIAISVPLTYTMNSGAEDLGRHAWVAAVSVSLIIRYLIFSSILWGNVKDAGYIMYFHSMAIDLLAFPASLVPWLISDKWTFGDWDWLIVIAGYFQWFVIGPWAIRRLPKIPGPSDQ